ncbi:MAG: tetratricopeptide repeat protein [Deltaproteobacteria bacterium]|nr:tetratricopeptide repeat protein [Deltaproteobacteria bacterium]
MTIALAALAIVFGARSPLAASDSGPDKSPLTEKSGDAGLESGMTALLDDAIEKLAKARNEEGLERLSKKDYPSALKLLKEAFELDPEDPEIANNLGYIYYLLGNDDEAERLYREVLKLDPNRYTTHLNLADLLGRDGEPLVRLEEAARLLVRARELRGNQHKVILKQARVDRLRGAFQSAERFYKKYLVKRKPTERLRIELGDFYRDLGRTEEALSWYRKVRDEEEIGKQAAGRIWEIEVERQAKRFGWTRLPETIPAKARRLAGKGRILLNQGKHAQARRLFEEAVALAPGFSMARADLGDLFNDTGRRRDAEISYLRALAVDHGNAEIYVRLGELYLDDPQGKRAAEATLFLSRALSLRPDWTSLHLTLARALRASGDLGRALHHIKIFLGGVEHGDKLKREALALKRSIEKLRPAKEDEKILASSRDEMDSKAATFNKKVATAIGRARAHMSEGRPEAAIAELKHLTAEHRTTPILNLEAQILYASGRPAEAIHVLTESLKLDEKQSAAHEQLGTILASEGRRMDARKHFIESERLGNAAAEYHLVRLDVGEDSGGAAALFKDVVRLGELNDARARLNSFLARGSTSVYLSDAKVLRERLVARIQQAMAVIGTMCVAFIAILILLGRRMWGGMNITSLIARHPEAGPEVQRVLSAIRHEVLKHNTMVLTGLVEAIEKDEDAAEKAKHLRRSLLGGGGGEPVSARLRGYIDELVKTGRSFGVRLNLKRKDPAVKVLLRGFHLLDSISPMLDNMADLDPSDRARVLGALKNASHLLNKLGYTAVQRMLDQIRVLEMDMALLKGIEERVRLEPAFTEMDISKAAIKSNVALPCRVVVARRDFEDILKNLIRNALQSSSESARRPIEIGLGVDSEIDTITGLERIVIFVRDRADKELTEEMIRGRDIEGGLGLTAKLISRYEGTIDVVPGQSGWSKAVRIRLPMAPAVE